MPSRRSVTYCRTSFPCLSIKWAGPLTWRPLDSQPASQPAHPSHACLLVGGGGVVTQQRLDPAGLNGDGSRVRHLCPAHAQPPHTPKDVHVHGLCAQRHAAGRRRRRRRGEERTRERRAGTAARLAEKPVGDVEKELGRGGWSACRSDMRICNRRAGDRHVAVSSYMGGCGSTCQSAGIGI